MANGFIKKASIDTNKSMKKKVLIMRWVVWGLAVAFYFYEYLPRVSVSVMVTELEKAFMVQAGALGLLSSLYLFAYAPMQLPVGLLMDRYGARRLLTFAAFGVGVATIVFGLSPYFWLAELSRFITGGASAFAFIGMIYVCSHWFGDTKLAAMIGIGNSIGMLGAVTGQGPLSFFIEDYGWRLTMIGMGIIGLALGFIIYLAVRNEPPEMAKHGTESKKPIKFTQTLKLVLKNKWSWINAIVCLLFYTPTGAFAALWGVPFLETTYGLTTTAAGFASSMFFVGTIVAGPFIGIFSDRQKKRKPLLLLTTFLTFLSVLALIYTPNLPVWSIFALFFISGAFSGGQLLCYSLAIELNNPIAKGTAVAFTNFMVFLGSASIQPFVGFLLDTVWNGTMSAGVPLYSASDYKAALVCFPISVLLAFICAFFLRDGKDIDIPMFKEISQSLKGR